MLRNTLPIAAAAVIATTGIATTASAVPVRSNFTVEVTSTEVTPPNVGDTLDGFITFDSAFLGANQTLTPPDVTLSFDLFGVTVTEQDDIEFPFFPEIEITDSGQVQNFDFVAIITDPVPQVPFADAGGGITFLGTDAIFFFSSSSQGSSVADGDIIPGSVQVIPLPAALGPMALALFGLVAVARRRMS